MSLFFFVLLTMLLFILQLLNLSFSQSNTAHTYIYAYVHIYIYMYIYIYTYIHYTITHAHAHTHAHILITTCCNMLTQTHTQHTQTCMHMCIFETLSLYSYSLSSPSISTPCVHSIYSPSIFSLLQYLPPPYIHPLCSLYLFTLSMSPSVFTLYIHPPLVSPLYSASSSISPIFTLHQYLPHPSKFSIYSAIFNLDLEPLPPPFGPIY